MGDVVNGAHSNSGTDENNNKDVCREGASMKASAMHFVISETKETLKLQLAQSHTDYAWHIIRRRFHVFDK